MTARVLIAARLSRSSDASTSIERQQEQGEHWAQTPDEPHTVVKVTKDSDVSGAVSPFKREDLGPWLTDPVKIAAWDVLVVSKLDRLTRSIIDFATLLEWMRRHNKVLVSIAEGFDLGTPHGRFFANMLAIFAQFERERIAERHQEAQAKSRELGRWRGVAPYGYKTAKQGDAYRLVQCGETAAVLDMVARARQGASYGQIALALDRAGVKPRKGVKWSPGTVKAVLTSVTLMGWRTHDGKVNRDASGEPITYTDDPILDREAYDDLQRELKKRDKPVGERIGGHLLLRVAFCRTCGNDTPLYAQWLNARGYGYYRCLSCKARIVRMDKLESYVEKKLIQEVGQRELRRKKVVAGDDHGKEIGKLERDIETLRNVTGTETVIEAKQAEIAALKALPHKPDREVWEGTGQTVGEHWASLDREARGHFLRQWGVKALADGHGVKVTFGYLDVGSETFDAA